MSLNDQSHFFTPVETDHEKYTIIESLIASQHEILIKSEKTSSLPGSPFTTVLPYTFNYSEIAVKYINGPHLSSKDNVTVMFEARKMKFFAKSKILYPRDSGYIILVQTLYQLQRRNSFRVPLPQEFVPAVFKMSSVGGTNSKNNFTVTDLSTGGMAIRFRQFEFDDFEIGSSLQGIITVGSYPPTEVTAIVRYRRKAKNLPNQEQTFLAGCEFVNTNASLTQKIAFIVNDCHRQMFARVRKSG